MEGPNRLLEELRGNPHLLEQRYEDLYQVNQIRKLTRRSLETSYIIVATVPLLILYPFAQRFFVKGVLIGAVKG